MSKIITFLLTMLLIFPAVAATNKSIEQAKTDKNIEEYVDNLVEKVSKLLGDDTISEEQKIKKARQLMAENLDLEWMAKYSLGRHRKELSMPQLKDFIKIYSSYVIKSYADLIRNYKGQKAVIVKVSQIDDAEYSVKTELQQNGQPPIKIDYLIRNISAAKSKKPVLKISDIITEGMSMINSQQAQFNGTIGNEGIEALLKQLQSLS